MSDDEVEAAARGVLDQARARNLRVVTAESCTGGLVVAALTDIAGASDVVDRGFVTYSNDAKETVLGVPSATLAAHGAVSRQTAEAMAHGALARSPADISVAVTGIAGPGGGSALKPVGLVHFAAARRHGPLIARECRYGDIGRSEIRRRSVLEALSMLMELVPAPAHRRGSGHPQG
jgi:nicotinamide-nucleotide amidase